MHNLQWEIVFLACGQLCDLRLVACYYIVENLLDEMPLKARKLKDDSLASQLTFIF